MWAAEPARRAARRRAVLASGALVLLAHAVLLGQWTAAPGSGRHGDEVPVARPRPVVRAMQTVQTARTLQTAPAARAVQAVGATQPVQTAAATVPAARASVTTGGASVHPQRAMPAVPPPVISPVTSPTPEADPDAAALDAPPPSPTDAPQPGGLRVPTYATRLPPPTTLQFVLRRGGASGRAQLVWQTDGARYQLSLRGQAAAGPPLAWHSEGALDADGIAPERYAEWRRGRELRAANFQRGGDDPRITFSGPQSQHPLLAGAQDRLSWMLQLPAVLAANPALQAPGSTVQLFVAGARGHAEVWTFTVQGPQAVLLADGSSVQALHLLREPQRLYDTRADIWLDPARGHLPVRALLAVRPGGDGIDFVLEQQPVP